MQETSKQSLLQKQQIILSIIERMSVVILLNSGIHGGCILLRGVGIMLTSCVSGAQFSNYATFLTDPKMAPLSIVMTSLSIAIAIFVTPLLSLLLIGKRLPVDVKE
ncbi:probable sodium/metabolite cotransporter BASS6, chloroplastic isoform X3 [Tanacetum coccineum]